MSSCPFADETEKQQSEELNERQKNVLKEVCDAFISTSVPVGSRTISRTGRLSCSPATIRNEMADLEMMGYLFSPHTSAGRVPTEKGYRFYVNFLIEYKRVSQLEEALLGKIAESSRKDHLQTQDVLKTAIRYACQRTNLAGILLAPKKMPDRLKYVRLFRVLENKAMLVTIDESGNINDQIVTIPPQATDEVLARLAILLNAQLCHHRHHQFEQQYIEKTRHLLARYNSLLTDLAEQARNAVKDQNQGSILLDGFANFFDQPEFNDSVKMKEMLRLLDQKEALINLLAKSLENDSEIVVNIGSDSGLEIKDMSVVTAKYQGPNRSIGRIGLIGPLRMDYSNAVATLLRLSNTLSQLFLSGNTR